MIYSVIFCLHLYWFSLFINYYNLWVLLYDSLWNVMLGCHYFGFRGNFFCRLRLVSIVKIHRYLKKPHFMFSIFRHKGACTGLGNIDASVAATWYSLFFLKFSLFIKFCFSYKYTSRSIKFVIDFLLSF